VCRIPFEISPPRSGACPDRAPPRSAGLPRRAGGAAHAGGRAASRGRSREKCFKLPIRPKFDEEFPLAARCEANTKDDMKVFDSPPTATSYRKINGFALARTFLQAHAVITRPQPVSSSMISTRPMLAFDLRV